jgi:GGDEF domain-containing protein
MARLTDHDVRDAEHALRAEVALLTGLYARRMLEEGKAYIQTELEKAAREGVDVNGTSIGRAAAQSASAAYFGGLAGQGQILQIVEGGTAPAA